MLVILRGSQFIKRIEEKKRKEGAVLWKYLLIDPNESDKILVMSATKFCRYTRGNLKSKQ